MTALYLRVRELAEKATKGPWYTPNDERRNAQGYGGYLWSLHVFADDGNDDDNPTRICWCNSQGDAAQDGEDAPKLSIARTNAAFIAFCRTAAPALAEQVETARKALEFQRNALRSLNGEIQGSRPGQLMTARDLEVQDSWHEAIGAMITQCNAALALIDRPTDEGEGKP